MKAIFVDIPADPKQIINLIAYYIGEYKSQSNDHNQLEPYVLMNPEDYRVVVREFANSPIAHFVTDYKSLHVRNSFIYEDERINKGVIQISELPIPENFNNHL